MTQRRPSWKWMLYSSVSGEIDSANREAVLDWLNDRNKFHVWLTSIIIGTLVFTGTFGVKPSFNSFEGVITTISLGMMLVAILVNMVCVWTIPTWKLGIKTGVITNGRAMQRDLGITAWIGVIFF